jgi:type II secretory pathway pseudopilin PulG
MGIIAMMTGMGIYGLTRFQANSQVQTVTNDTLTLLRTVQNNAKNSVSFATTPTSNDICSSNNNCSADYYAVYFSSSTYQVFACQKTGSNITCPAGNDLQLQAVKYPDITFSYEGTGCNYISFQRLTGDIIDVQGNPLWTESSNSLCTVKISNSYGDSRMLEVNLTNNSIRDVSN